MRYVVDIDGTICDPGDTDATRYTDATPIRSRIDKINKLYDDGHYIVYLTARGMVDSITPECTHIESSTNLLKTN